MAVAFSLKLIKIDFIFGYAEYDKIKLFSRYFIMSIRMSLTL